MKIVARCRSCGKSMAVSAEHAGKRIRCPSCSEPVRVPEADNAVPAKTARRTKTHSSGETDRPRRRSSQKSATAPSRSQRASSPTQRPARKKKRKRRRPQEDDIFSQPLSSVGATIDEDDYETYNIAPRRRRKSSRDNSSWRDDDSYGSSRYDRDDESDSGSLLLSATVVGGVLCLLAVLGRSMGSESTRKMLSMPGIIIAGVGYCVGLFWILRNAFEEDATVGLMYMFLPFYSVYFLFSRWHVNMVPFVLSIICWLTLGVCIFANAAPM